MLGGGRVFVALRRGGEGLRLRVGGWWEVLLVLRLRRRGDL